MAVHDMLVLVKRQRVCELRRLQAARSRGQVSRDAEEDRRDAELSMRELSPSIRILEKRAKDLTKLLLPYTPEKFLHDLIIYKRENKNSNIKAIHFFP